MKYIILTICCVLGFTPYILLSVGTVVVKQYIDVDNSVIDFIYENLWLFLLIALHWAWMISHAFLNSNIRYRNIWCTLLLLIPAMHIIYLIFIYIPFEFKKVPTDYKEKGVINSSTSLSLNPDLKERYEDISYERLNSLTQIALDSELSTERYLLGINVAAVIIVVTLLRIYPQTRDIEIIKITLPILFLGIILVGIIKAIRIYIAYGKKGNWEKERIRFLNSEITYEQLLYSDYHKHRNPTLIVTIAFLTLLCYCISIGVTFFAVAGQGFHDIFSKNRNEVSIKKNKTENAPITNHSIKKYIPIYQSNKFVIIRAVNLRQYNSMRTNSVITTVIQKNQLVTGLKSDGEFEYVTYYDYVENILRTGWVHKKFIKKITK